MRNLLLLFLIALPAACQKPLDNRIADDARQWTETNCPKVVDEMTRLDSMTYHIPTQVLQYWYTVSGEADSEEYWRQYDQQVLLHKRQLARRLRLDPDMRELVANRRLFQFNYYSATTGKRLYFVLITPYEYE
ncbi:MAG: hypothetical protein IJS89_00270 [Bacteroidaceae bacterium]|nr:hypothetical protein [Bacteroidaceae bacterium]